MITKLYSNFSSLLLNKLVINKSSAASSDFMALCIKVDFQIFFTVTFPRITPYMCVILATNRINTELALIIYLDSTVVP